MDTNRQIDIMGIVNLTDDSYFAKSRCATPDQALALAARHITEGASILDIGAVSTRPGADPVSVEEEWRRLAPALEVLRKEFPEMRISVDTTRASVVEKAYDLIGDFIVNDISAGEDDRLMLQTAGRLGLTYIAMHKRGNPQTMQQLTDYGDVVSDVRLYFEQFASKAAENGIRDWIIDPGFGFAKTIEQNYALLRSLSSFRDIDGGRRLLVGVSRKSMIYRALGISPEEALPATQAVHFKALENGADILRVHDVAEAVRTLSLYRLMA
ncbi:MAG: dihydropteroate synthase [Bacteroidales bacterium]|nr:dihydropteroate synthase [Bacteroidales bacterium]